LAFLHLVIPKQLRGILVELFYIWAASVEGELLHGASYSEYAPPSLKRLCPRQLNTQILRDELGMTNQIAAQMRLATTETRLRNVFQHSLRKNNIKIPLKITRDDREEERATLVISTSDEYKK
jgi:hypothetical protein